MKKSLLFVLLTIITLSLHAQKDTINFAFNTERNSITTEAANAKISIYPVPVRGTFFTIRCDRDFSFIKITNIIGQDIYRSQYNDPQSITKIILDNQKRGMYLVSITFSDGSRIVKKITIEQTE